MMGTNNASMMYENPNFIIDLDDKKTFYRLIGSCAVDLLLEKKAALMAHHCCRGFGLDYMTHGIKKLSISKQIAFIKMHLESRGFEQNQIKIFEQNLKQYHTSFQASGREGKICFCLNKNLFLIDDGCNSFFKYFGGEAMYRPFEGKGSCEILDALSQIGEPLVITFPSTFSALASFEQDNVVNYINDQKHYCQGSIAVPVLPNEIISIKRFNN